MGLAVLTDGSEGPLGPPAFSNFFYRAALAQKASFIVDNALGSDPATVPLLTTLRHRPTRLLRRLCVGVRAHDLVGPGRGPGDRVVDQLRAGEKKREFFFI